LAEQSSLAVAVRAFVMLGCLVALPLVALFGNVLPEAIDAVMEVWRTPPEQVASTTTEEAPLFEPLYGENHAEAVPEGFAPDWPSNADGVCAASGSEARNMESGNVLAATYDAPAASSFGNPSSDGIDCSPKAAGLSAGAAGSRSPPTANPLHSICGRLKELGATYVLLESWGDNQEQFRFYCKIAIAGNPHYTYRFEATDGEPLRAMTNVLRQVEAWSAARYGN